MHGLGFPQRQTKDGGVHAVPGMVAEERDNEGARAATWVRLPAVVLEALDFAPAALSTSSTPRDVAPTASSLPTTVPRGVGKIRQSNGAKRLPRRGGGLTPRSPPLAAPRGWPPTIATPTPVTSCDCACMARGRPAVAQTRRGRRRWPWCSPQWPNHLRPTWHNSPRTPKWPQRNARGVRWFHQTGAPSANRREWDWSH